MNGEEIRPIGMQSRIETEEIEINVVKELVDWSVLSISSFFISVKAYDKI